MKQKFIYIIVIGLSLVLLWLIWLLKEKELDARLTFGYKDKIPYGCFTAYTILQNKFGEKNTYINKKEPYLEEDLFEQDSSCLMVVNSYFNPTDSELDWLTFYAQKGNTVIISTTGLNHIAQKFFNCTPNQFLPYSNTGAFDIIEERFIPMQVQLGLLPNNTKYVYPGIGYETHFTTFDTSIALPIGKNSVSVNTLLFKVGNGNIVIHLAPVCFTNLFLLHQNNASYVEGLLQLIPTYTKQCIWSEYFLHQRLLDKQTKQKGLLSVLLQYENFKWSIYILLTAFILLLLTAFKRKQQIIPVYTAPANESLQFIETVGELYYNRADHKNLADKMIAHFFDVLRTKHHIKQSLANTELTQLLMLKTTIPEVAAKELIDTIQSIQFAQQITPLQLQQLYQQLQLFYKTA